MRHSEPGSGPFTYAAAIRAGETRASVRAHLKSGRWLRLRHGVFVTREDRLLAGATDATLHAQDIQGLRLALTRREVVAAESSAARILGFESRGTPDPELIVTCAEARVASTHRDGYFLRVAPLADSEVRIRHGVPVTAPARTVVDLAANRGLEHGVIAAESAYRQALLAPRELREAVEGTDGRPGIHTAREVLAFANPLTESVLETVSLLNCRKLPIPLPLTQVVLWEDPLIRVDFLWPDLWLVGEADGMAKYGASGREPMWVLRAERDREQRIRDLGHDIVRWDWRVANNPRLLATRLLPAVDRARARLRGRAG